MDVSKKVKETMIKKLIELKDNGIDVALSSPEENDMSISFEFSIPKDISNEEAEKKALELISIFDEAYREMGGSGLKVDRVKKSSLDV